MAKLTLSDAARVAGVARSTLHRAIKGGRLSRDPDGTVDTAELLRAGYTLQHRTLQRNRSALQDATGPDSTRHPPLTLAETLTMHGAEADGKPADLWRARSTLQEETLQDASGPVAATQHPVIPGETLQISPLAHAHELLRLECDLLRRELEAAHQREQAALEVARAAGLGSPPASSRPARERTGQGTARTAALGHTNAASSIVRTHERITG